MLSPAQTFLQRFVNNENAHALQTKTGAYKAFRNAQITDGLFEEHLIGAVTIGCYAIDPVTQTAKWLCWDCDTKAEDQFANLINWLNSFGIIPLRESRREGRSGHLWVFLERPIPSHDAFRILKHGQFLWQIPGEVFPAQTGLRPDQIGSLVRLPLGRHQKPSAKGVWGLFEDCPGKSVDQQLMWFIEQPLNSVEQLLPTIPQTQALTDKKRRKQHITGGKLLDEFPEDWDWKGTGPELSGPCPVCRQGGGDRKGGNLSLNTEQNVLCCHRNGQEHTFQQIIKAARVYKNNFTKLNIPVV